MLYRLPKFDYACPDNLTEALALLNQPGTHILAGGTDILVRMKERKTEPRLLLSLRQLTELKGIANEPDGGLSIGPATSHAAIMSTLENTEVYGLLSRACGQIGTPQVRNQGTVGGNLANANPSADSSPALLALDASVELISASGKRTVPLDQFFTGPFQTVLAPDELMASIIIPSWAGTTITGYQFLTKHTAVDETLVSVAIVIEMDENYSDCRKVRIALCSVAPTPIRATAAEKMLTGNALTDDVIAAAARAAADEAKPRSRAAYRRRMIEVLTRRALTEARTSIAMKGA